MANKGINKVIIIGNLGQDPEIRYMPNGSAVANLNLATSESWKDKNTGEIKERTEWHRVVIFSKLAEVAKNYLRKGSQVYIEGSLQTRKWQDQNGIDRYITEIIVNIGGTMHMLGTRNNNFTVKSIDEPTNTIAKSNKKSEFNKISTVMNKNNFSNKNSSIDNELESDYDDEIPF